MLGGPVLVFKDSADPLVIEIYTIQTGNYYLIEQNLKGHEKELVHNWG